ncbi:hypothetical protein PsorP6_002598 [Peronosclerospora sorghi]|uniref:Uncharacterized protein n=1 Tax=Peronosclerospora sorghi TaxID=230839 RepID=A0ACC0WUM5_9STRA|nr:hypothetical protein PsorP6_002598 [Peronosclerospora sorghi]
MSINGIASEQTTAEVATQSLTAEAALIYRMQLQPRPHVTFDESVVDNENLGRRRSNKCCIFHKKREFGESSSESDEDSDTSDKASEHPHDKNCKHKSWHRRTGPKKCVPSPFSSDEEKGPMPLH